MWIWGLGLGLTLWTTPLFFLIFLTMLEARNLTRTLSTPDLPGRFRSCRQSGKNPGQSFFCHVEDPPNLQILQVSQRTYFKDIVPHFHFKLVLQAELRFADEELAVHMALKDLEDNWDTQPDPDAAESRMGFLVEQQLRLLG